LKISLIYPGGSILELEQRKRENMPLATGSLPPLGIFYLKSVLDLEGYQTSVLDHSAHEYPRSYVMNWIKKEDPDVVGFSVLTSSFRTGIKIARAIKEWNPNVKIVFGNFHATSCSEKIVQKYQGLVDFVVRGEGEIQFPKLLDAIENNRSHEDIKGLTFKNNGKIIKTPDAPLIEDLDTIPFPDRDCVDVEYRQRVNGVPIIDDKFTTVMASRGCTYQCTYCATAENNRRQWRKRSVSNIIDELLLLEEQNYKMVVFTDPNMTINRKWVIKLMREMKKQNLDMYFSGSSRVNQGSLEMYREMAETDFISVLFGIESGNNQILKFYKKNTSVDINKRAIKTARRAGIKTIVCSYILGAPMETLEDIRQTIKHANSLDVSFNNFNILEAIPGTDLWDYLVSKDVLDEEKYWETGVPVINLGILPYTREDVLKEIYKGFLDFINLFRRPIYMKEIVRTLSDKIKFQYFIKFLSTIHKLPLTFKKIANSLHPE
jgi:radical SAM superfamily enzyme YgiQ (UPF0313 family)